MSQDLRDITTFLKSQRALRDSKEPLERPSQIDDPRAHPAVKEAAAQFYASEILKRASWTPEESKFISSELAKYAREQKK